MTTEQTTFHRSVVKAVEEEFEGDNPRLSYALYELMTNINRCDGIMRRSAQAIRDRLAEMERNLDGGYTVYQVHISNPTNDMTEAVAKREAAFTVLNVLIGADRLKELIDNSKSRFAVEKAGQ